MNKNKLLYLLILLPLGVFIYLIVSFNNGLNKVNDIEEPAYVDELFIRSRKLRHVESLSTQETNIGSVYNFNNFDSGILVYKNQTSIKSLKNIVSFKNDVIGIQSGKMYFGSIFRNKLEIMLDDISEVKTIEISINGFDENMIKSKSDTLINLVYDLKDSATIGFNNSNKAYINATKGIFSEEINQLVIKLSDENLYIIYMKPISNENFDTELINLLK